LKTDVSSSTTSTSSTREPSFKDFAFDDRTTVFGEVSQPLRDLTIKHAGGITVYAFLQGLDTAAAGVQTRT